MGITINHHIAIRTSHIEGAVSFYDAVLGAKPLCNPWIIEGDLAEMITEGPPGVRVKLQLIGFEDGPALELYEFLEPAEPTGRTHATKGTILHIALQVDSVVETLALIEANGGERILAEPINPFGTGALTFAADPDGNVLELIEMSPRQVLDGIWASTKGTAAP